MTGAFDSTFDIGNLKGLASLRGNVDSAEGQRAVAKQFESLFLNMMLKQMRSASLIEGGLIDSQRLEFQQSLFDEQLALSLARGRGIGLADSILRSLGGPAASADPAALPTPATGSRLEIAATPSRRALADAPATAASPGALQAPAVRQTQAADERRQMETASPEAFVAAIWGHAETAAAQLGTTPDVIVAQAALETGWGRSMPRNQYGESSLNLFGIKAGADWHGPKAVVTTLEVIDGVAEKRREPFRMYSRLADSFDDYVGFLKGRAHYADALAAGTPEEYVQALQRGGYATDPDYASKIIGILERGLPGREASANQVSARRTDKEAWVFDALAASNGDRTNGDPR